MASQITEVLDRPAGRPTVESLAMAGEEYLPQNWLSKFSGNLTELPEMFDDGQLINHTNKNVINTVCNSHFATSEMYMETRFDLADT